MFTVKIVTTGTGAVELLAADQVGLSGRVEIQEHQGEAVELTRIDLMFASGPMGQRWLERKPHKPDERDFYPTFEVYVMNDAGRTVETLRF